MAAAARPLAGVGLGWRRELATSLLAAPRTVGFVEVIAESCFAASSLRREVQALAEVWPVLPHGIKLSLGSADGIDDERARKLGALARSLRAPLVSEHVAFTRGAGRDIGHLTQLPMSRAAVAVVARNVGRTRRYLPDVPFLLENPAWTLRWPDDEMGEGDFFHEIVAATGCDLLLDIANVYANALNSGQDPVSLLRSYPLSRVAMVHIAGGAYRDGFYVDTHCHATPPAVMAMLAEVVRVAGPVPVVLERDGRYPPFSALAAELAEAAQIVAGGVHVERDAARTRAAQAEGRPALLAAGGDRDLRPLLRQQGQLAQLLTSESADDVVAADRRWDVREVARSRDVLHHKRADEALPYLPRMRRVASRQPMGASGSIDLYALALQVMQGCEASQDLPAIADALRIADALAEHPQIGFAAAEDGLYLRAQFVRAGHRVRRRWLPFLGSVQLPDGRRLWGVKAVGRMARVRTVAKGSVSKAAAVDPQPRSGNR